MNEGNIIRANWENSDGDLDLINVARAIGPMGEKWGEFHSDNSKVEVTLNAEGEQNRQTIEGLLKRAGCVIQ